MLKVAAVFGAGLALAFVLGLLVPQLDILGFAVAFLLVLGVAGVLQALVERRWVFWSALPAAALTGVGVLMLAEDLALGEVGRRTEVVVLDHDVRVRHGGNGTTYTHYYTLERAEGGARLEQRMVYRGKSGYAGADEGKTITVLVDPAGKAPVRPAKSVDVGADIAVLVVGSLAAAGVFTACTVSLRRQHRQSDPGVGQGER